MPYIYLRLNLMFVLGLIKIRTWEYIHISKCMQYCYVCWSQFHLFYNVNFTFIHTQTNIFYGQMIHSFYIMRNRNNKKFNIAHYLYKYILELNGHILIVDGAIVITYFWFKYMYMIVSKMFSCKSMRWIS